VGRLAILVALAAVLTRAGAGSASPATRLEQWVAFRAGSRAPGVHVLVHARGSCRSASLADPRADAWRCLSGGQVQDPCFSGSRSGAFVLCPDGTPDSRDAIRLALTAPLPTRRASPREPTGGAPWVIETEGLYCYRVTAAPILVAGRRASYECAGASALAGIPERARTTWTIELLPTAASKHTTTVPITAAWW
jgi:hypothetical protein